MPTNDRALPPDTCDDPATTGAALEEQDRMADHEPSEGTTLGLGEHFFKMYSAGLQTLLELSGTMSKAELRVLLHLIYHGTLTYRNEYPRYIDAIAQDLAHDRSTVGKALGTLVELGLVVAERDPRGGATTWQVTPELVLCGDVRNRAMQRRKWRWRKTAYLRSE